MDKDYILNDIVMLILQEINLEEIDQNILWYIIEDILLDYVTYEHDRFTKTIGFHTG